MDVSILLCSSLNTFMVIIVFHPHMNPGKYLLFPFHRWGGELILRKWKCLIQNYIAGSEGAGTSKLHLTTPSYCSTIPYMSSQPFFLLLVRSYPNPFCYIHVELFVYSRNTVLLLKLLPSCFHPRISFSSLPPCKTSTHLYNPGKALPPLPDILITFHLYKKKNFCSHEWH